MVCKPSLVSFHFPTDYIAEEMLIDFREIIGEHSGENLAHAVWETMELYGLKGRVSAFLYVAYYFINSAQIIAVSCDNASNNDPRGSSSTIFGPVYDVCPIQYIWLR